VRILAAGQTVYGFAISLNVTPSMSESFDVLVFHVLEDGETVADRARVYVQRCFDNEVRLAGTFAKYKGGIRGQRGHAPKIPNIVQHDTETPQCWCAHKALLVDGTDGIKKISKDKSLQTKLIYDIRLSEHLI